MSLIPFARAAARSARYRAAVAMRGPQPEKLRLAVTNRCNARCVMCNVWKADVRDAKTTELSTDEYRQIFANSSRVLQRLKHVSLTGGETTLRPDLADIVGIICGHHPAASINVNTNAFDTSRLMSFVDRAVAHTVKLTVMVSLDGMGETHDKVRGVKGAFDKTYASIQALLEFRRSHPLKVGINTTLGEWNSGHDLEEIYRFCATNQLKFTPIVPQSGEFFHNESDEVSLRADTARRHAEHLRKLAMESGALSLATIEVLEQLDGRSRDYRCWAGTVMMLIEEQGEVFPNGGCPSSWSLGNLRSHDYDIGSIVASPQAQAVLGDVRDCRRCRLACETLTTLRGPEALAAYRKSHQYAAAE